MSKDKISKKKDALELIGNGVIKGYMKHGHYGEIKKICEVAGVELPKGLILDWANAYLDGANLDAYCVPELYKAYHLFELAGVTDYPKDKFTTYATKCFENGEVEDALFFSKVAGITPPKEKSIALADGCLNDTNIEEALMLWKAAGVKSEEEPQKTKLLAYADAHLEHASQKKLKDTLYVVNPHVKSFYTAYKAYKAAGMTPSKEKFGEALLKAIGMEALQ